MTVPSFFFSSLSPVTSLLHRNQPLCTCPVFLGHRAVLPWLWACLTVARRRVPACPPARPRSPTGAPPTPARVWPRRAMRYPSPRRPWQVAPLSGPALAPSYLHRSIHQEPNKIGFAFWAFSYNFYAINKIAVCAFCGPTGRGIDTFTRRAAWWHDSEARTPSPPLWRNWIKGVQF